MNKSIYELDLHEEIKHNFVYIRRVPGGWIYTPETSNYGVFVPFDNEFQEDGPEYLHEISELKLEKARLLDALKLQAKSTGGIIRCPNTGMILNMSSKFYP